MWPSIAYTAAHYIDVDQRVRIVGLQARPELNGCIAFVTPDPRTGERVPVSVDGGTAISIRPTNLEHVSEAPVCELRCRDAVFLADKEEACGCETIRDALELAGDDDEAGAPTVSLPLVDAASVAAALRICRKIKRTPWQLVDGRDGDATRYRLLRAAAFLDCPPLLDRVSENLAHQIRRQILLGRYGPSGFGASDLVTPSVLSAIAKALRERFNVSTGLLSDSDAMSAHREDRFTAPFAGKKRVPLAWPDDAIDEDQFEATLLKLSPEHLRFVKGVSTSWRVAARRVLCSAHYQAKYFTLAELVKDSSVCIAARIPGVLARLDVQPIEAVTPYKPLGFGGRGAKARPVQWGLCEYFWKSIKLGDGRKGLCQSIMTKADGAALAAAVLSRLPPPPEAAKSWELVLGTEVECWAPALSGLPKECGGAGISQNEMDAEVAALTIRTLLRPADKGGYGLGGKGLAAALGTYIAATPACEEGKHLRASVVKELARCHRPAGRRHRPAGRLACLAL